MTFEFGHGLSGATVTLDRVNNERGYTIDNVVLCRLSTNAKKGNRPVERLIEQLELDFSGGVSDVSQPLSKEESNPENKL
jgi:hypothetical protein